jgi:glycosyltransferase involved in cell wall biosynthesis
MDTTLKHPRVTVLMPVFNGEKYLPAAIKSILSQTYTDFELLIIEDGSTDGSPSIIKGFKDPRIRVEENGVNKGLVYSRNRGIEISRGEYIACMDCDDISLPERLAIQVAFMDAHPDIGLSGTWLQVIDDEPGYVQKYLTNPDEIKANLLFYTSIAQPSAIIRKSVLESTHLRYDNTHMHYYEDYGLWVALSLHTKISNIPRVLVQYRVHAKSFSHSNARENKIGANMIRKIQLERLGMTPSERDMLFHNSLKPNEEMGIEEYLKGEEAWLKKIRAANGRMRLYRDEALDSVLYNRWRTICGMNTAHGIRVWNKFISSDLSALGGYGKYVDGATFFIKCLL